MLERACVTGASGFVGSAIVQELAGRSVAVNALVHRRNASPLGGTVRVIRADLFEPASLDESVRGCEAVIHLVGIIREEPKAGITFERLHVEATRNVVESAKRVGVKRFIQMSALGARADAVSQYHKTKWKAEEIVRGSGMNWTIFQPSLIHGPGGEFMRMEARWVRKQAAPYLFMPYFGAGILGLGGAGTLQPVYVLDVARAFVDAITNLKTVGRTYGLGGAERMSWPEMHRAAARAILGKNRAVLPIPAWYGRMLAAIVPGWLLPFNRDQIVMSQEDNTCDVSDFQRDFGWTPLGFAEALREYSARL
ncbi:MAG: NAD(P)H-binding protein [Tepidisphaeraceae bacterium]|jgi:NADH dehydrogenase